MEKDILKKAFDQATGVIYHQSIDDNGNVSKTFIYDANVINMVELSEPQNQKTYEPYQVGNQETTFGERFSDVLEVFRMETGTTCEGGISDGFASEGAEKGYDADGEWFTADKGFNIQSPSEQLGEQDVFSDESVKEISASLENTYTSVDGEIAQQSIKNVMEGNISIFHRNASQNTTSFVGEDSEISTVNSIKIKEGFGIARDTLIKQYTELTAETFIPKNKKDLLVGGDNSKGSGNIFYVDSNKPDFASKHQKNHVVFACANSTPQQISKISHNLNQIYKNTPDMKLVVLDIPKGRKGEDIAKQWATQRNVEVIEKGVNEPRYLDDNKKPLRNAGYLRNENILKELPIKSIITCTSGDQKVISKLADKATEKYIAIQSIDLVEKENKIDTMAQPTQKPARLHVVPIAQHIQHALNKHAYDPQGVYNDCKNIKCWGHKDGDIMYTTHMITVDKPLNELVHNKDDLHAVLYKAAGTSNPEMKNTLYISLPKTNGKMDFVSLDNIMNGSITTDKQFTGNQIGIVQKSSPSDFMPNIPLETTLSDGSIHNTSVKEIFMNNDECSIRPAIAYISDNMKVTPEQGFNPENLSCIKFDTKFVVAGEQLDNPLSCKDMTTALNTAIKEYDFGGSERLGEISKIDSPVHDEKTISKSVKENSMELN